MQREIAIYCLYVIRQIRFLVGYDAGVKSAIKRKRW